MSVFKPARIDFTNEQIRKIGKMKPIRIAAKQIGTGDKVIMLNVENHAKLSKAKKANKGCMLYLTPGEIAETVSSEMSGSGFLSDVWGGIKKGFKWLKDSGILSTVADAAVAPLSTYTGNPTAVAGARKLLRDTTGVGMKSQKKQYIRHRNTDLVGSSFKLN